MKLSSGTYIDCLTRITTKGGVDAKEAERLLEEINREADLFVDPKSEDRYVEAAQQLWDRTRERAMLDNLDAMRNAAIRAKVMKRIEDQGGLKNAPRVLRDLMHGTNIGSKDSVEAQWRGVAAGWQGLLSSKLHRLGIEKLAISGQADRDVARELWAINAGEPKGQTKNAAAQAIAEAIAPLLDNARDRVNAAGGRVGKAIDYVTHTSHDPDKMRAAAGNLKDPVDDAFAAWWKNTEPLLGDKTYAELAPKPGETEAEARMRFGRSVYDALVSGIHMSPEGEAGLPAGADGFIPPAFEGTRNLARKVSQQRVLYWKDGGAWHDYMKLYGASSSLTQGVMGTLDRAARVTALMEKMGTNPAANLQQILRRIQETYRDDLDGIKRFQTKVQGLENVMAHLDGSANIPVNRMWARLGASVRTWETMSDLGGVGITHFASIWPTVPSELVHHGVSRLEGLGAIIKGLFTGRGGAEKQAIDAELGAYAHGLTRDMWARWQPDQPVAGRLSSMANVFMKYTGIHYIFDNTQAAVREVLANNLARNVGQDFGGLEPHLRMMLGKYGIGPEEWGLMRKVDGLAAAEGRQYFTPRDAMRVDAGEVEALLRARGELPTAKATELEGLEGTSTDQMQRAVQAFRQGLADKLYAYYGDAAKHSVVTAGIRERAMVLGQDQPGTFGGEMRRFLMQFKMWPLAAMNQVIGREIYMSLSKGEAAWNLGVLMALSSAAGYMRMSVNDAVLGHPLRDPLDPRTMLAGLAQGGGVGILGDFLFGEALRNRFGSGLVGTLGGPAVADVDEFIHLYNGWLHGKMGWPELAHFGVRHIPFANLVYLKGALDYMLWYHLYEAASPGWWERANRRILHETGRTMTGYSPGQGVPWTPWGLGSQQSAAAPQ